MTDGSSGSARPSWCGAANPDDAVRLAGPTVELIEALGLRTPFTHDISEDDRWLFEGLAAAFDQLPPG